MHWDQSFRTLCSIDIKLTEHDDLKRLLADKINPNDNTQTDISLYLNKNASLVKDPHVVGRITI